MAAAVTVAQFADVLKVPVERLLEQLAEAGVDIKDADALVDDDTKMVLLNHLQRRQGNDEAAASTPTKVTLNRRDRSELKVSGSAGRARTVNVEVRRKRTYVKRDVIEEQNRAQQEETDSKRREEEEARLAAEKAESDRIAARKAEKEAEQRAKDEEAARRDAEREERLAEVRRKDEQKQAATAPSTDAAKPAAKSGDKPARGRGKNDKRESGGGNAPDRSGRKKLHVASDMRGKRRTNASGRKSSRRRSSSVNVDSQHGFELPTAPVIREVSVVDGMTVGELAQGMAVKGGEVIKSLMGMGMMVTINQPLDQDTAIILVEELGHIPKPEDPALLDEQIISITDEEVGEEVSRSPVVTIMGHVDHGKTSLLDYIRRTKVTADEAGGITQHIGAYKVHTDSGDITFLDTPGHAAFTSMRERGAKVTDVVILVVAGDDGVKPQTEEAVKHAKAAGVPIIVAINKMDKPEADPERVRNELSQLEVISEEWGGDTQFVNVSAHTGDGVDALLGAISLQAELLELTAFAGGRATGVVIESSLERGRGSVATVLVTRGTLRQGDVLVAGQVHGKVRRMHDDTGATVMEAGPGAPVAVLGLSGTPVSGDDAVVLEDERKAREVAEFRHARAREIKLSQQQAAKLDDVFGQLKAGAMKSVTLLVKADVHGSAEALCEALEDISNDEVNVKIVSSGVGAITETDVNLAATSKAIIIGFNVRADGKARDAVKEQGIDIQYFSIIYEAIDVVKAAVTGLLAPEIREEIVGLAEVRDVFTSPKFGDIAGCLVTEGFVKRDNPIRVLRDSVVIYEGELESLRRFKDDVNEVRSGTECGIGVKDYNDVQPGDQIECFQRVEIARTLDSM
ncbi:MAG: translation initiation factor IF-2 [Gammaproteobacteria bacterium]|nr:translation initiation factor IF-2 [Gammaproteobacteria bacterium]